MRIIGCVAIERFAARLGPDDHVVLEATGNTTAIVDVFRAHAGQVIARFPTAEKLPLSRTLTWMQSR